MADIKQLLKAACDLTGDSEGSVLAYDLSEDTLTLVIDRGIKGAPKFIYTLDELNPQPPPEPQPEAPPKPATRKRRTRTAK